MRARRQRKPAICSGDHNGTSTVNDLLDAMDAEMRGQKRYPAGHEGHVSKREGFGASRNANSTN
jgi:hypothetical protein